MILLCCSLVIKCTLSPALSHRTLQKHLCTSKKQIQVHEKTPDQLQLAFQSYIFYMDPNASAELTAVSFNKVEINNLKDFPFKIKRAV